MGTSGGVPQEVDFIAPPVAARLADLEIRTVRQLAARLNSDTEATRVQGGQRLPTGRSSIPPSSSRAAPGSPGRP